MIYSHENQKGKKRSVRGLVLSFLYVVGPKNLRESYLGSRVSSRKTCER